MELSKIERDAETDTAYIYVVNSIDDGEAVSQVRATPVNGDAEIILDFDAAGFLLGVEIIGASRVLRPEVNSSM